MTAAQLVSILILLKRRDTV